jgi:hypothetical protein
MTNYPEYLPHYVHIATPGGREQYIRCNNKKAAEAEQKKQEALKAKGLPLKTIEIVEGCRRVQ